MNDWISVKDRLPDENDDESDYLITDGESYWVGYYRPDAKSWDSFTNGWVGHCCADGSFKYAEITHWMPLPEPPTE